MFGLSFFAPATPSEKEAAAIKESERIMSDARRAAAIMVRNATEEAQQILNNAKILTKSMEDELRITIKTKSDEMSQIMQTHLNEAGVEYSATLKTAQATFQDSISDQLRSFSGELSGELSAIRRTLSSWILQQQQQLKDEMSGYQSKQEGLYAAKLSDMLPSILGNVVSKSLSTEDHEKLIQSALEEARGAGVWQSTSTTQATSTTKLT